MPDDEGAARSRIATIASPVRLLHPASLLCLWAGFAISLQFFSGAWLYGAGVLSLTYMAGGRARSRGWRLILRTRWVLLSLLILFAFFSSGEYLPGLAGHLGMTYEGLFGAGEHLLRLLAVLASLAVLHEVLGNEGIVSGLYRLLGVGNWQERSIVRLMLVLDHAEQAVVKSWREWLEPPLESGQGIDILCLQSAALGRADYLVMIVAIMLPVWSMGA